MRRILTAAVVTLAASVVHAEPAETSAQAHVSRGIDAFEVRDFVAAQREFAAARALAPDAVNPHLWLARTAAALGDCVMVGAEADQVTRGVEAKDPRALIVNDLRVQCRLGRLTVTSSPPRVALRLDGIVVGDTPWSLRSTAAGTRTLVATRDGYHPLTRMIELPVGEQLAVQLELRRVTPTRLTRRWWFWPAVAGAVAAALTGVAIAVSDDSSLSVLPPVNCADAGCTVGVQ
jgi:hypothetical protein